MRVRPLVSLIALSLALAGGPALAQQNIDKVFGGITAEAGQSYGSLETVNGGITIREGATVRSAETVNGGITIERNAQVGGVETVNGGISLDDGARVRGAEAVNGGIRLGRDAKVDDDVEVVNGGDGRRLRSLAPTSVTCSEPPAACWMRARAASASSPLVMVNSRFLLSVTNFLPSSFDRRAVNPCDGCATSASIDQYSWALKASISSSRSTIMRNAGDCTRPADSPRCTLRHSTGDRLKPTR